ncbi:hypothetical protein K431DRAFT_137069 [Polychaeton citri CBS 116435]|uniref:Fork-head domain-containing protein n=1 Tax=Polychaeton citri CBS 116435 TaxID=1314669 RepID=A0A9P4ULA7_9PEZI|nr:hypothetical protein K431DRAFT_137069 [Polychaeton citri CBS 116435]
MSPSTMSSTRRSQMVEIYQDPDASFAMPTAQDVDARLLEMLNPLCDASNKQNITFNPTPSTKRGSSPTKTNSSPPRPLSAQNIRDIDLPPPRRLNFDTESPRKHNPFYSGPSPLPRPETAPLSSQFSGVQQFDGSFDSSSYPALAPLPYPGPDYGFKAPGKRMPMDPGHARDRNGLKKPKFEEQETFDLPDPTEMPVVVDDGTKPPHSYATLIGMAILRAPNRRLTLASIYKWISDSYAFYRVAESGWQNSIRHNLSLNKNFIKQERPKDDPGKGNYWAIKPGQERTFLVDKKNQVRRITNPDGSQYIHGLPGDVGPLRSVNAPAIGRFTLAPNSHRRSDSRGIDSAKFPEEPAFSSDGTIPGSDPAMHEEDAGDTRENAPLSMAPPPAHLRSSPPPEMGSSPPQMERKATPPPVPRFTHASRSGGRQRKFQGLNDSGYWSSIESSAARNAAHVLTSEADIGRPRIRKGRAEAEIARIRSSSFDSPSKDKRHPSQQRQQLSPLKDESPLTPAVVFKRPQKPPASVSPNTNLRNHRDRLKALLASPVKTFSPMPAAESHSNWSPGFGLSVDDNMLAGLTPFLSPYKFKQTPWKADTPGTSHKLFDVFIDAPEEDLTARGSPEKRTARRPSLARAATSSGILADVTGNSRSNVSSVPATLPGGNNEIPFSFSPFLQKTAQGTPSLRSPAHLGSPLKQMHKPSHSQPSLGADLDWFQDENLQPDRSLSKDETAQLFGVELPSDASEEGIDIFQDFGKIGSFGQPQVQIPAPDRSTGSPVKRSATAPGGRPPMARSVTSRW